MDHGESNLARAVNRMREELVDGRTSRRALDRERMCLARKISDRDSIRLDIQGLEARRFNDAAVTALFDLFDKLKDKIVRFEVRGPRLLRVFLRHASFYSSRAGSSSSPREGRADEGHGTFRGKLFNAEVFHNGALSNGTIRVFGAEREESPSEGPRRSRHSFELTCRA